MRTPTMKLFLGAVAACSVVTATDLTSESEGKGRWISPTAFFQDKFEQTTSTVQQLFGSLMQHATSPVQLIVVEDVSALLLTRQEKLVACSIAMDEVKARQREAARGEVHIQGLRSSMKDAPLKSGQKSRCGSLGSDQLVSECERFIGVLSEGTVQTRSGDSKAETCESIVDEEKAKADAGAASKTEEPPLSCKLCKRFVQLIDMALKQDLEEVEQAREIIGDICDSMSADSKCHVFIKQFDQIVEWVRHGTDPEVVCEKVKMCTKMANEALPTFETVESVESNDTGNDHACFYCVQITSVIRFVHEHSPDQMDSLKTILKYGCKMAPKDCGCDQMEKSFDHIVDLVKQGKEPKEVCQDIKICKNSVATASIKSFHEFEDVFTSMVFGNNQTTVQDDKKCFYCDYFATMIEVMMQEDPDQIEGIREFADTICQILGDKSKCHVYLKKIDFVIDSLKKGKHPREICIDMGYCSKVTIEPTVELVKRSGPSGSVIEKVTGVLNRTINECFMCMEVTTVVRLALDESPDRVEEIKQIMHMVCGLTDKIQCRTYAEKFDEVVDLIRSGADNHAICKKIGSCDKAIAPLELTTTNAKLSLEDSRCIYCDGVVTVLQVSLKQKPDDVNEMREAAGIVCDILPEDDQCHAELKMFDKVVQMLKSGKGPREICQKINFCKDDYSEKSSPSSLLHSLDPSLKPSRCTTCKQNTMLLSSFASSPESLKVFEKQIQSTCRLIPQAPECKLLLEHYNSILEQTKEGEDVEGICHRINQCSPEDSQVSDSKALSVCCLFCEYTAELVNHAKHDETELRLAKEALETMCSILPPNAKCDILSSKFDVLVTLLESGKTSSEACEKLGLCGALIHDPSAVPMQLSTKAPEAEKTQIADLMAVA